jgi:hypothetical protein
MTGGDVMGVNEDSRSAAAAAQQPVAEADVQPDAAVGDDGENPVMELLSEKVPLSLIMDLSTPAGPDSEQILEEEGEPEEAWWEQPTS